LVNRFQLCNGESLEKKIVHCKILPGYESGKGANRFLYTWEF
jgi:hypothetical protein